MSRPQSLAQLVAQLTAGLMKAALLETKDCNAKIRRLTPTQDEALSQSEALFPGSFNPLHEAHRRIADCAAARMAKPVWFELSMVNVDKLPLSAEEVERRLAQFAGSEVWLTRAATFPEKAALFPGATFVAGIDTLARIAEPRYYGGSASAADSAIAVLAERGCRFLVFGRQIGGRFCGLDEVTLPRELRALCEGVPETEFRLDVSSTQLRANVP